jgi:23S rRNA pseudouridine1911/1915/1917 synthase
VRVIPRTGRTHQIRVHFADLGYPIAGDRVYGVRRNRHHMSDYGSDPFSRQALHAEKLVIRHPATRQMMEFYAPLPQDMENRIAQFRKVRSNDALGVDKENGFTYYNPQRNRFTIS